ncbi:MAG: hypothetical protein V7676_11025 [Parasphingorhabdus sp.]|uniref:hypothetical protein n=1 Tax=Parasphingorhabdus sp. TaxID=2709688 RepID=UPI003001D466
MIALMRVLFSDERPRITVESAGRRSIPQGITPVAQISAGCGDASPGLLFSSKRFCGSILHVILSYPRGEYIPARDCNLVIVDIRTFREARRSAPCFTCPVIGKAENAYVVVLGGEPDELPAAELDDAVNAWTDIIGQRSPTALALAKRSFNADSDNIRGISQMALNAVKLFYDTDESKEGVNAFTEKRAPDFHKYVK